MIDIQIAIMNLSDWCSKWHISINSIKANYMVFYDKTKLHLYRYQLPLIVTALEKSLQ